MGLNRTEFLKLSVWGFVATLLPLQQIKALSFISDLKTFDANNYNIAIEKAKEAKLHFFKKEYSLAENLYLECISLAPADIRFYDNLQNVYGAQGKFLMCVELFKNGLSANPEKINFYDRAARSLMRLELGYNNLSENYKNRIGSISLLNDALELYKQAIQINDQASFLKIGYNKVMQKIESNAAAINYREDIKHLEKRKERKKQHNARYDHFSIEKLESVIESIDSKKRNTLFFTNEKNTREKNILKEKKIIYTFLIKKYKNQGSINNAIYYANQLYSIDNNDTFSVNVLKRMYMEIKDYNSFLDFQIIHNRNRNTVYSNLGLMSAYNLMYKNELSNSAILDSSISIGEDLYKNWGLINDLKLKVVDQLSQTYCLKNDFESAINILEETIQNSLSLSEGMINALIFCYAKVYYESEKYAEAKDILLLGLKKFDKVNHQSFLIIKEIATKKELNKFTTNLRLRYLLYKTYKKLADEISGHSILQELLQHDKKDKFALKHI